MTSPAPRRLSRLLALGATLALTAGLVPAAAAAPAPAPLVPTDTRTVRCLEGGPDPIAKFASMRVPAAWTKTQPTRRSCRFDARDRSLHLRVVVSGEQTTVDEVRRHRIEYKAADDAGMIRYREKRWSRRGNEVRWVYTIGDGRTYRIFLSQTVRLELPSPNALNQRAARTLQRALSTLRTGTVRR